MGERITATRHDRLRPSMRGIDSLLTTSIGPTPTRPAPTTTAQAGPATPAPPPTATPAITTADVPPVTAQPDPEAPAPAAPATPTSAPLTSTVPTPALPASALSVSALPASVPLVVTTAAAPTTITPAVPMAISPTAPVTIAPNAPVAITTAAPVAPAPGGHAPATVGQPPAPPRPAPLTGDQPPASPRPASTAGGQASAPLCPASATGGQPPASPRPASTTGDKASASPRPAPARSASARSGPARPPSPPEHHPSRGHRPNRAVLRTAHGPLNPATASVTAAVPTVAVPTTAAAPEADCPPDTDCPPNGHPPNSQTPAADAPNRDVAGRQALDDAAPRGRGARGRTPRPADVANPTGTHPPADAGRAAEADQGSARSDHRAAAPAGGVESDSWERRYRGAVITSDIVLLVLTMLALLGVLGTFHPVWLPAYPILTVLGTTLLAVAGLAAGRAWRPEALGQGAEEFQALGRGLVGATVAGCMVLFVAGMLGWRVWSLLAIPFAALALFPMRYVLRRYLHRARRQHRCLLPVLAAGSEATVHALVQQTRRAAHVGWRVEAICLDTDGAPMPADIDGVPVIGSIDELGTHVRRGGYRIVAATPCAQWTPRRLQALAWELEGSNTDMVIAPGLMEIAGPRVHISGVLGMPVVRVSEPRFTGMARVVKEVTDRVFAGLGLLLLLSVLALLAVLIKLDGGPVFYRQLRSGRDGREFRMWKFRTMVVGADRMRASLGRHNDGSGPLFKMRADPRVTRVGSLLRRYSLDELPQLFNVLAGQMSLVGPRPPLPEETVSYTDVARRRLLVKPGLTGLWQVSGRSDLSWDESVRLDLRYVEDWSLTLDLVIMWKTVRAVVTGNGAY